MIATAFHGSRSPGVSCSLKRTRGGYQWTRMRTRAHHGGVALTPSFRFVPFRVSQFLDLLLSVALSSEEI